jgi:hypothetical protein
MTSTKFVNLHDKCRGTKFDGTNRIQTKTTIEVEAQRENKITREKLHGGLRCPVLLMTPTVKDVTMPKASIGNTDFYIEIRDSFNPCIY